MRRQSIHKKLLKLAVLLLTILLIFQITLLFCFNFIFKNVKYTVEQQNLYTTYESTASLLQNSVTDYLDSPTPETRTFLNHHRQVFCDLSEQIYEFFQKSQFEDSYILAAAYTDKIQELTDSIEEKDEEKTFLLYKECSHLYSLLLKQHSTTLTFEMAVLSEKLDAAFKNWNCFNLFLIALMAVVFLIILLCTSNSIQKIAEPLSMLSGHAKEFEQGNDQDETPEILLKNEYSEIYTLSCAFIHMEHTIRDQITALKDKIELSKKVHALELKNISTHAALSQTENSLMQSLVNPHFLFNCLNLLASFAIIEKAPTVHEYSLKIAQYLRESLNYVGKQITLEKEFAFIRHYAAIQQLRFGSRIRFTFQCEEYCNDAVIPAIILQPLIENALIHGVGSYLQNGEISVAAKRCGDEKILITVEDNGSGIEPQRLDEIKKMLHTPFQVGQKGTGIRSVLYRLNYCYHDDVLFQIESVPNATSISITIPYQAQNSDTV